MDPNPLIRHTFWTVLIGSYTTWVSQMGVGQGMVQRYLSLPNLKAAKWLVNSAKMSPFFFFFNKNIDFRAIFIFSLGLFFTKILSIATGLLVYAQYSNCDPLSTQVRICYHHSCPT
jgi:sodium-coupled monocarboxylate transporter 8/12